MIKKMRMLMIIDFAMIMTYLKAVQKYDGKLFENLLGKALQKVYLFKLKLCIL
jgi:hypothetical protein